MAECLAEGAAQGHRQLQFLLAEHHRNGTEGLETGAKGMAEAAKWYAAAAVQGHVESRYRLDQFYRDGDAQPKGAKPKSAEALEEAERLLEAAARKGHVHAGFELGEMLLNKLAKVPKGDGNLAKDGGPEAILGKAFKFMEWGAAKQGDPELQYRLVSFSLARLGWMCETGRAGMASKEESEIEAVMHYTEAVQGDDPPALALRQLAIMCIKGRGGLQKGSGGEVVKLLERAAAKNDGRSMHRLGRLHARGDCGLKKDVAPDGAAVRWLTKAAKWGVKKAKADLEALEAGKDLGA